MRRRKISCSSKQSEAVSWKFVRPACELSVRSSSSPSRWDLPRFGLSPSRSSSRSPSVKSLAILFNHFRHSFRFRFRTFTLTIPINLHYPLHLSPSHHAFESSSCLGNIGSAHSTFSATRHKPPRPSSLASTLRIIRPVPRARITPRYLTHQLGIRQPRPFHGLFTSHSLASGHKPAPLPPPATSPESVSCCNRPSILRSSTADLHCGHLLQSRLHSYTPVIKISHHASRQAQGRGAPSTARCLRLGRSRCLLPRSHRRSFRRL